MRHTLTLITTLLLSPLAGLAAAEPSKPNLVLIFADDLGYGDVGCYGATKVMTPNIDRLASEGRRFTDAHSASAVCTPSRYALLTGEYPFRKDLWGPVMNPSPLVVDPARTTVASLLKRQGYATACFGKWHLGFGSHHPRRLPRNNCQQRAAAVDSPGWAESPASPAENSPGQSQSATDGLRCNLQEPQALKEPHD